MFDVAQDECRAFLNAQSVEDGVEAPHRLSGFGVERVDCRLREAVERRSLKNPPNASASELPLQGANRNREDEASKGVAIAEATHFGKDLKKDFLRQIVGPTGRPERPLKEPKDHRRVLVVCGRGCPEFAGDEGVRQLGILRVGVGGTGSDTQLGGFAKGRHRRATTLQ